MGHTILISVVRFTAVPPGVPTALPHGINIEQSPRIPDRLDLGPSTQPFTASADLTNVTVTNLGGAAADIDVWCELEHSIQRVIAGNDLTPQPFVAGGSPSGGGGGSSLNLIDGTKVAPSLNYVNAAQPTGYFRETSLGTGLGGSVLGVRSLFIGYAPAITVNGQGNTFVGYGSGGLTYASGATGYNNTFVGGESGANNDSGYWNTFVGSRSGHETTSGFANTYVGQGSGYGNTTGSESTAIGWHAGLNVASVGANVFVGAKACEGAVGSTASSNVAIGWETLKFITNGIGNVAVGFAAGQLNVGAGSNVFVGNSAGMGAVGSTASYNVFVGENSGQSVTSAQFNSALGRLSLQFLTSAQYNTAMGAAAGLGITTGTGNTVLGTLAGYTAIAANAVTTGSYNTYVGYGAGPGSAVQRTRSTAIGYGATGTLDDCVVLGAPNTRLMAGAVASAANAVDSSLGVNQFTVSIDEVANSLFFRVRYADSTLKTGTVALI